MTAIEMTLDDSLLVQLDDVVNELKIERMAFIKEALLSAIQEFQIRKLEEKHRRGYELYPIDPDEFYNWPSEEAWGEA